MDLKSMKWHINAREYINDKKDDKYERFISKLLNFSNVWSINL